MRSAIRVASTLVQPVAAVGREGRISHLEIPSSTPLSTLSTGVRVSLAPDRQCSSSVAVTARPDSNICSRAPGARVCTAAAV